MYDEVSPFLVYLRVCIWINDDIERCVKYKVSMQHTTANENNGIILRFEFER